MCLCLRFNYFPLSPSSFIIHTFFPFLFFFFLFFSPSHTYTSYLYLQFHFLFLPSDIPLALFLSFFLSLLLTHTHMCTRTCAHTHTDACIHTHRDRRQEKVSLKLVFTHAACPLHHRSSTSPMQLKWVRFASFFLFFFWF